MTPREDPREEWEEFLGGIAREVHELIREAENLQVFRESLRRFAEQVERSRKREEERCASSMAQGKKDWTRALHDDRFRNCHVRPKGSFRWGGIWWDATCGCGRELVERDGKRYHPMPACFGAEYRDHLLELAAHARKESQELSPQNPLKRKAAEGAKKRMRLAREVKAELALEAQNRTGQLLLSWPWWNDWPSTVKDQYREDDKGKVAKEKIARIGRAIGEHFGCWRRFHPAHRYIVDKWFPDDEKRPGELPPLYSPLERRRRYVVLASIHDHGQSNKIGTDDIWPPVLADGVWGRLDSCQPQAFRRRKAFIQAAFDDVKHELSQKAKKPGVKLNRPGQTGGTRTEESGSDAKTINIGNLTVIMPGGNATINIEQHTEYITTLRDAVAAQPENSPTFATVAKKTALDIIGSALKDVAKGQVTEAAKQIYELGKDLGPVIVNTAAYAFLKSYLAQ